MSAPQAQFMIDGYLRRLDAALTTLPRARRQEIVGDIRAHIAEARSIADEDETDADVLTLLDRIGDPEAIAREAHSRFGMEERTRVGPTEFITVLLLGVGNLIVPLLSWCVGALLLWRSRAWIGEQKRRSGTLALAATLAMVLLVIALAPLAQARWLMVLPPIAATAYSARLLGGRMPSAARVGATVVTAIIALPAAVAVLPSKEHGFVKPESVTGTVRCGAFYGTFDLGGPLGGAAHVDVGYCVDGHHVRTTWGPDCSSAETGTLVVDPRCGITPQPGGGFVVTLQTSYRAWTSIWAGGSEGRGWVVLPDGRLVD